MLECIHPSSHILEWVFAHPSGVGSEGEHSNRRQIVGVVKINVVAVGKEFHSPRML